MTRARDLAGTLGGGATVTVASGTTVPLTIQNNGTGNSFVVNDVASDTTPLVVDNDGNVGLGTAPGAKLDIYNSAAAGANNEVLRIRYNTSNTNGVSGDVNFTTSSGTNIGRISSVVEQNGQAAGLAFGTYTSAGTVEKLRLEGAGYLAKATLRAPKELTTVSATAATGTIAFDAVTQGVLYYTSNAGGNWTLNVRGDSSTTLNSILAVGDSITVVFMATQGGTAYYATGFQVDGNSVTPKWQGGTAPTSGNTSSIDGYVYTIIKTAATPTYTVLASQTKFA